MAGGIGIGAILGSVAQPIAAHFAQKRQHKYIKKYMKNKYQWMVDDLRAAGLNPILAYNNQPSMGQPGIPSIAGGQGATALGAMKIKSELRLLETAADKNMAEAELARGRTSVTVPTTKKLELEVSEFKPTLGGVARRLFNSAEAKAAAKKFLNTVGDVPNWIRENLMNAAERK